MKDNGKAAIFVLAKKGCSLPCTSDTKLRRTILLDVPKLAVPLADR